MLDQVAIGIRHGLGRLVGIPKGTNNRPLQKPSATQIAREIVIGRRLLTRLTKTDQGFELEKWVRFLDATPSLGLAGELSNPDVWETFTRDAIATQKSPEFQKYLALAQEAWNAGLEADVTYESLHNEWLAEIAKLPEGYNE